MHSLATALTYGKIVARKLIFEKRYDGFRLPHGKLALA